MSDEIEKLREELAEANARRDDLRTTLEWANEERDRLQRERDEARAEVERLRALDGHHAWVDREGLIACASCGVVRRADGGNKPCRGVVRVGVRVDDEIAAAYRRGAEAMREACARWMSEREGISQWVYDDALSALPIPEEP